MKDQQQGNYHDNQQQAHDDHLSLRISHYAQKIMTLLFEYRIKASHVFVRQLNDTEVECLFLLPLADFTSTSLTSIYSIIQSWPSSVVGTTNNTLSCSFCPYDPHLKKTLHKQHDFMLYLQFRQGLLQRVIKRH